MILLIFLFLSSNIYAEDAFFYLRERHLGEVATGAFTATLDDKSATTLLKGIVKKPYRVELSYRADRGIELLVKDTESFYEYALESYAKHVNTMLFPLLDTTAYTRLQKKFTVQRDDNVYRMSFQKGDISVLYVFEEGKLGLVDKIQYFEDDKRVYVLDIQWVKVGQKYVPIEVKSVSYIQSRQAASFKIENILLK